MKLNASGSGLVYGTYLTGSLGAQPLAITLDAAGEATIAGYTTWPDFPVTAGAPVTTLTGQAAFISRLNTAGTALVYSTFFGSDGMTAAHALASDASGAVYAAGATGSAGFVVKLNNAGTAFVYSAALGGNGTAANAVAVDGSGDVWVAGETGDPGFPLTSDAYEAGYARAGCAYSVTAMFAVQNQFTNCGDAFLSAFDPSGAKLTYSTIFGGNGADRANALAIASDGSLWLAGSTNSDNLPATTGAFSTVRIAAVCSDWESPTFQTSWPCDDAFVARFNLPAAPALWPFSVVNAASQLPGAVAPGELVSLLVNGIGPSTAVDLVITANGTVATSLSDLQVLFDGVQAPLIHAESSRITLAVPFEVAGKPKTQVTVSNGGVAGPSLAVQVIGVNPGAFTMTAAAGQAACLNQDGTINRPQNPAAAGSVVALFLTGLGSTIPQSADGTLTNPSMPPLSSNVVAYAGGQQARVLYAGDAPDLIEGAMQVNFALPTGAGAGMVPVFVAVGNLVSSQGGVWIWVK